MKTSTRVLSAVMVGLLLSVTPAASAESGLGNIADAIVLINKSIMGLSGRVADHDDEQSRIWMAVARRLASHPDLAALFGREVIRARRSGEKNQQLVFLNALIEIACKNFEDGCALKAEVEGIRQKNDEQDRRLDRLEQLGLGQPIPHEGYYRGPSDLLPTPADPPRQSPSTRIWPYGVDRITHRKATMCPTAYRIEKCVEVPTANGLYHGDLYEDCSGQIVLVRHVKTVN